MLAILHTRPDLRPAILERLPNATAGDVDEHVVSDQIAPGQISDQERVLPKGYISPLVNNCSKQVDTGVKMPGAFIFKSVVPIKKIVCLIFR